MDNFANYVVFLKAVVRLPLQAEEDREAALFAAVVDQIDEEGAEDVLLVDSYEIFDVTVGGTVVADNYGGDEDEDLDGDGDDPPPVEIGRAIPFRGAHRPA